jgi:predicted PurR-regulated permease PerM
MNDWLSRSELKAALLFVLLVVVTLFFGWLLRVVIFPLLVAAVFYVLSEPLVSSLQRRGWNRSLVITFLLGVTAVVVIWIIAVVIPPLTDQFELLRERLPQAWERFSELMTGAQTWLQARFRVEIDLGKLLTQITENFHGLSASSLATLSGWLANLALWLLLIPAITFFLLRDYRTFRNALIGALPNNIFERGLTIYHRVSRQLQRYVRGVLLQSLIMSIITGFGFFLVGIPMAAALGLAAGVLNLIPYLGPLLGLIPPVLVALSIGASPEVIGLIVMIMVVAQINDNFIVMPTILARAANLHPLVALIGVIVGGNFFGFAGMIVALPVLSTARIVFNGLLVGCSQKKNTISV